jgi:hypothetical protein
MEMLWVEAGLRALERVRVLLLFVLEEYKLE